MLLNYVSVQEEKAMEAVPKQPIERSKFCAFVHERRKKKILFKGEYLVGDCFLVGLETKYDSTICVLYVKTNLNVKKVCFM